ncbi:hypothetical protein [Streptomyces sp. NPDC001380]|uniref:hypothetical protein n=1 Tax=Streptomyces sp. NPDC001380 TaxID=3364566 RepID=UPI0036C63201
MTLEPRDRHPAPRGDRPHGDPHYGDQPYGDPRHDREAPSGPEADRRPPRRHATAAAVTAAVLAAGGTVAYAVATDDGSSGSAPAAAPAAAPLDGMPSAGPAGPAQADPGQSAPPSSGPQTAPEEGLPLHGGAAVHGEATVRDPGTGRWTVRVWQRGTVASSSGASFTVRSADGAVWTWRTGPDTATRDGNGGRAPARGSAVLVSGTRGADGTDTAALVLARPDGGGQDGRTPPHRHGGWPPWTGGGHRGPGSWAWS